MISIVARLIRKLRRDRELSQAEIAHALGLQQNVMSRMELGKRQVSLGGLRDICSLVGITLSEFVERYEAQAKQDDQARP